MNKNKKILAVAVFAGLCLGFGVNSANAEVITYDVPDAMGDGSGFTLKDNAEEANTTIEVPIYSFNTLTNELTSQTKYLDITKKTYTDSSGEQTLTYTWNPETNRLTVARSGASVPAVKTGDSYIGDVIGVWAGWGKAINTAGANIEEIIGDFVGNGSTYSGSAVYPSGGSVNKIEGNFISNYTTDGSGGAIGVYAGADVDTINGNFIGNYSDKYGSGAIHTSDANSRIRNIQGVFINNYAHNGHNGAICISTNTFADNIEAIFVGNIAKNGGALSNHGTIGTVGDDENLTGGIVNTNFISNNANNNGGGILNSGSIGEIKSTNFVANKSTTSGGAIYNSGTIGTIESTLFLSNYSQSENANVQGGAIFNSGTINIDTSNFISNYAKSESGTAQGGAIYNDGTIGEINAEFTNNYVGSTSNNAEGGAIANVGTIEKIFAKFIGNYTHMTGINANGGAVYLYSGTIKQLKGTFENNHATSSARFAKGGAIYNGEGEIDSIDSEFTQNYVSTDNNGLRAAGGAIAIEGNNASVKNIKGTFDGNYAISSAENAFGGVLYLDGGLVNNITGDFKNNYAKSTKRFAKGGAILCLGKITNINGNFIENHAISDGSSYFGGGGAIFVEGSTSQIGMISGNFIGNYSYSTISNALGGAITNNIATIGTIDELGDLTGGIVNSNFAGNYAKSESGAAQGGAIWTNNDLNIIADNGTSTFKDNYVQVGDGEKDYQAIWVEGADKKLNLQQFNNGKMYMYDNINGTDGYTVNIEGDGTGTMYLFNDIKNANVTLNNTTLNTVNNDVHDYHFNSFTMNGDANFVADVDLVNESMDRISADSYGEHTGTLTVTGINLLNDADKDNTKILFADEGLADNVDTTVTTVSYSPIYKYNVSYNRDEEDNRGYFSFARSSTGGSGDFNPAVIAAPVATQAAAQVTMEQTFNYSFSNSDTFMLLPKAERLAIRNRNKYAIAENELPEGANPLYQIQDTSSAWFKPYASFENVPLKNGPKVNVISYGALAGYDTDLKELKRGWARAWTGFVGYNGANLNYNGVTTNQNGGILGGTLTMYKGNFFNATTLSAGASVGENNTMYGHETTTSLLAGIGNKTGYNLEFIDGKFIVQPSLFLGYTFVKTFDYTNAAGVRIDSDPAHTFQISPGLKFIGNLKHGWQPYIGVNMVWNVLNNSHVKANSVTLPQMSVKPYIQYGIGLQKTVKDNFVAYGQAMVQNGGRNGISLTAGFRWAIGKGSKPVEKVQKNNETKLTNETKVNNPKQNVKQIKSEPKEVKENTLKGKVDVFFNKMNGIPYQANTRTRKVAVVEKL